MTGFLRAGICLCTFISFVSIAEAREPTPGEIQARMMTDTINGPHQSTIREESLSGYHRDYERELEEERRKTAILMRERCEEEETALKRQREEEIAAEDAARERRNESWRDRQDDYKPAEISRPSYTQWDDEDKGEAPRRSGKKLIDILEDLE